MTTPNALETNGADFSFLNPQSVVTLDNCSREAIHLNASIQRHAAYLVIDPIKEEIVAYSENLAATVVNTISGQSAVVSPSAALGVGLWSEISSKRCPSGQYISMSTDSAQWATTPMDVSAFYDLQGLVHVEFQPATETRCQTLLSQLNEEFLKRGSVNSISQAATKLLREATGYDQCILYRFDDLWNGEAIAEAKSDHLPSYLGKWFPESDVPYPARLLMTRRPFGSVYDHTASSQSLIGVNRDSHSIDLSHSVTRSVSRMCSSYYINMGILSTAVIPLMDQDRLWGFFSLWSYEIPRSLNSIDRASIVSFSQLFLSQYFEAKERGAADAINEIRKRHDSILQSLKSVESIDSLFRTFEGMESLFPAHGQVICFQGRYFCSGSVPPYEFLDELVAWLLKHQSDRHLFFTRNLESALPSAAAYRQSASGALVVTLISHEPVYLMWFRPEILLTLDWAHRPTKSDETHDHEESRLCPTGSQSVWSDNIAGFSREWRTYERKIAERIRTQVGEIVARIFLRHLDTQLQEAVKLNDMKTQFLRNMSHELRTPLHGLIGNAALLEERVKDAELQSIAEDIRSSANYFLRTIDNVLAASRLATDSERLTLATHDVSQLIQKLCEQVQEQLSSKRSPPIIVNKIPTSIIGELDEDKLGRVLLELVSNSIKFSPEESDIIITATVTEEDSSRLELSIIDLGKGMNPLQINSQMDLFHQVDISDTRNFGGAGLGLAIVTGLVRCMEGTVTISSKEGLGTCARVTIPVRQPTRESIKTEKIEEKQSLDDLCSFLKGKRILIAEDHPINRRIARKLLEGVGVFVTEAHNGLEAVHHAKSELPDAIIMDIQMPECDGIEALRKIRPVLDCPIIAFTANVSLSDKERYLDIGFSDYIAKPIDRKTFLRTIGESIMAARETATKH